MFKTFRNALKIKDVRSKLLFTLICLIIVRIGCQLPVPEVDREYFQAWMEMQTGFGFLDTLTGGSFSQMSIFALNISPYITSSIIMQLLTIAIPKLEEMQKDGETGRKKIAEWTRYVTIGLAVFESVRSSREEDVFAYGEPFEYRISEIRNDFHSFISLPTDARGKEINGIVLESDKLIIPWGYKGRINVIYKVRAPEITVDELMDYIPAPDFPTGGVIMGRSGIRQAYRTGQGKIVIRSRCEIEEYTSGGQVRSRIIVTEIPYQVNKAVLVKTIADMVKDKRLEGISDIRDESGRDGMRIVIEIKKDANAQVVLNTLYKKTKLQSSDGIIILALVENGTEPKTLNLQETFWVLLMHTAQSKKKTLQILL